MKPEFLRYLFFDDIYPRHVNHNLPVAFHESIRGLTTRGGSNDVQITGQGVEVGLDCFTKELLVTVTAKTLCVTASLSTKETKSRKIFRPGQDFKRKDPIISSCTVHKDKDIMNAANSTDVAETNIM